MTSRGGWGEGTLTDLGGGKWRLRLPPHLGRGQVTFRARTKTEAKKEQRRLLDQAYAELHNPSRQMFTFKEWCDRELDRLVVDPDSIRRLRTALKTAIALFGDCPLDEITYEQVAGWRAVQARRLAGSTLHTYTQAVKQMFNAAVLAGIIKQSPAAAVKNPSAQSGDIFPFETLDEVVAVAEELPPAYRALPVFGVFTGLRVEELLALERGDLRDGYVHVNKRFVRGVFKQGTKNGDPERRVVLAPEARQWLEMQPARLDTRLLWANGKGTHLDVTWFRTGVWNPAVEASGVQPVRRMKDMRHTYASWHLRANTNTCALSKQMGTAVKNIEDTYGRWIQGSERVLLAAMSSFGEVKAL